MDDQNALILREFLRKVKQLLIVIIVVIAACEDVAALVQHLVDVVPLDSGIILGVNHLDVIGLALLLVLPVNGITDIGQVRIGIVDALKTDDDLVAILRDQRCAGFSSLFNCLISLFSYFFSCLFNSLSCLFCLLLNLLLSGSCRRSCCSAAAGREDHGSNKKHCYYFLFHVTADTGLVKWRTGQPGFGNRGFSRRGFRKPVRRENRPETEQETWPEIMRNSLRILKIVQVTCG